VWIATSATLGILPADTNPMKDMARRMINMNKQSTPLRE